MHERDTSLSKFLSLVLRHEPGAIGLVLDEGGWLRVDRLLSALAEHGRELSLADLEQLVQRSDKQRFAFSPDGSMIRANQGHSVRVNLGYQAVIPPSVLFHGTVARFLPSIREQGLLKSKRHHVHLSATPELATVVARRRAAGPQPRAHRLWKKGAGVRARTDGASGGAHGRSEAREPG